MKKVLALVLAVALTIGGIAIFADAEALTEYEGSVVNYSFTVTEGDAASDLYVKPGETFTVTLNMQTNFYTGVQGREAVFYTSGVLADVATNDVVKKTVANYYSNVTINANLSTNAMPAAYKTGYKAVYVTRVGTAGSAPVVYDDPTPVYAVTFTVPANAENGSTVTFLMPREAVASDTVSGRSVLIAQRVINNTATADGTSDVAKDYAETVNLPEALTITVGEPPVLVDKTALAEAIATLPAIGQDEATSATWAAYADALAAGQVVFDKADATQEEVDAAKDALVAATAAVTRLGDCDYTELDAAIAAYEALNLDLYTPNSVTNTDVTAKYDAAKAVTRDMLDDEAGANQGTITTAAQELNAAIAALVLRADKTALGEAITAAQAKVEADYTPNSWTAADLVTLIPAAQNVYNDANATVDEVAAQVTALTDAMDALVLKADKTELETAIATLPDVAQNEATSASWAAYADALAAANDVDADANATQTAVDDATTALVNATNAVEKLADCDYTALNNAIAAYDALDLTAYTPNSVTASDVAAKAEAAKAVPAGLLNDEQGANQGTINAAASALTNAIAALQLKANKEALTTAIADAESKDSALYTPDSWTDADLDAVLLNANTVLADDNAEQDAVDAQVTAIGEAVAKLVLKADKTLLAQAIEAAQSKDANDYTPSSWELADLANVIPFAQGVYDDDNATEQEVAGAIDALNTAVGQLVAKADKTALAEAIATLPDIPETEATSESWNAYEVALSAAQDVYDDAEALQDEVDTATNNLLAAIDGVTRLAECDYDDLDEAIADYEALTLADYTPASVTASDVTAKYAAAKNVTRDMLDDEDGVNQGVIDAAAQALNDAIDALVAKGDKTELIAEIAAAPAMDEDTATDDSWNAYQAELVAAQAVVDDDNAVQQDVDDAKAALVAAKELVSRGLCDYDALDAALALAPEKDADEYTEASWAAYADAKAAAEDIARDLIDNKAGTNQASVNDAAAALEEAYNNLTAKDCSILSFTCMHDHYKKNELVTFAFVVKAQNYAKIQVVHDGDQTLTYERGNAAVQDIVANDDGTETWYINIKIYSDGEFTYKARAKYSNAPAERGWDPDYFNYNGKTSTGDDAAVKSVAAIVNGEEVTAFTTNDTVTLRVVAGKDTRRVRFTDTTRGLTMTLSTPKEVNLDGTKVFEISRKLGEPRDYTYAIDTADSTNKWTRSDETLSVSVSKYVAPAVVPSTGNMDDAVISVDASARVLRFQAQTFTVVTDKNASGFRLVDKNGNAIATQKTGGVTEGDQTTWTLVKYYSATGTFTYKVQALYGKTWVDSGKTVTFTVAY